MGALPNAPPVAPLANVACRHLARCVAIVASQSLSGLDRGRRHPHPLAGAQVARPLALIASTGWIVRDPVPVPLPTDKAATVPEAIGEVDLRIAL